MTDNREAFEKWVLSRETRFALRRDRWMPEEYEDADTQLAWCAWQAARQEASEVEPKLNIKCETKSSNCIGTTALNVIRVEREDDGSFTAVTDFWPNNIP